MIIPTEQISTMLELLAQERPKEEQDAEILDRRNTQEALIKLLGMLNWNAIDLPDGRMKVLQYTGETLDLEHDAVLKCAIGIVLPGSLIEGYSEGNQHWQLRYHLFHTTFVHGTTVFPRDPDWENLTRTFTLVRNASPGDQPQLEGFIRRPLDWTEGHILVAEHANGIRAFLHYHFHQQIEQTAIVTRIITHPLGRRYGYPQSLVKALQQRSTRVLIEHPSPNYKREWRKLGFFVINKEEKTKFRCPADTFVWTKGTAHEENHRQGEEAEAALRRFLADRLVLWHALVLKYASLHRREMQFAGRWFLVPDGIGSWKPAQTDVHPLALPLPEISQEEYERFGGKGKELPDAMLNTYREAILAAWSPVRFLADDSDNPFWNPAATSF
jgi:hypothetical protein